MMMMMMNDDDAEKKNVPQIFRNFVHNKIIILKFVEFSRLAKNFFYRKNSTSNFKSGGILVQIRIGNRRFFLS